MINFVKGEIFFEWPILFIILAVGLFLIKKQPYTGFLFATFVSLSFGRETLLFSKIPGLGFINLIDICLLLSIIAFLMERPSPLKKDVINLPKPAIGIFIILIIGLINSLIRYEQTYAIIRAFRWAINLPILFVIAANIITDKKRVKYLLWVLLLAAILSSLQHLLWLTQLKELLLTNSADSLRTIAFIRGQESWLAAGPFMMAGKIPHPLAQICVAILFLITFFAQQTRSIAIGLIMAIIAYYGWFLSGIQSFRVQRLLPLILIFFVSIGATGSFGFADLAENYSEKLIELSSGEAQNIETRVEAFDQEIQDFLEGNMIIGEGLAYFFRIGIGADFEIDVDSEGVAYGHLGYVTYLSQLGILGFIVYVWFPFSVLLRAKNVFEFNHNADETRHLAMLTATTFLSSIFTFIFSGSFLNPYMIIPGILAGAVWAMPVSEVE